jgi:serine/threonine-protein kinase
VGDDRTVFHPFAAGSVKQGTRLNGLYEIEELIAQGGMGEVYRGFNIQTMDPVAIKMIRLEFSNNKEIFELFRREASILHNLSHEAIVRYFVFSVDPDLRRAYLAMEFVEGPSLTSRFATGPIQLADVHVLRRRIAAALEAAHQHGVIHRDISPDNIILPQGDVRSAKVIDFGIARSLYRGEESIIGGRFAGKYNFASPEQFGLAGGEVSLKSDIYSFGLVLAAALRGSPIDMSGSEVEAIAKRSVLPDLSDIDPTIRPLLQAMLQPAPANRPASMAEVVAWEPQPSRGLWTPSARSRVPRPLTAPPTREAGGGRAAAILGAAIALASLGGAAFMFRNDLGQWSQSMIASRPPSVPEKPQTVSMPKQPELPKLTAPEPSPANPPQGQGEANNLASPPSGAPVAQAPASSVEATNRESEPGPRPAPPGKIDPARPGPASSGPSAPPRVDDIVNALRRARERPGRPPDAAEAEQNRQPQPSGGALGVDSTLHNPPESLSGGAEAAQNSRPQPPGIDSTVHGPPESPSGAEAAQNSQPQPSDSAPGIDSTVHSPPESPSGGGEAAQNSQPQPSDGAPGIHSAVHRPSQRAPESPAQPLGPLAKAELPPTTQQGQEDAIRPSIPPSSSAEKAKRFVAAFNGGDCFFIKRLGESGGKESYLGFGRDLVPFQRFDTDYKTQVGDEADIRLGLIGPKQCAAIDLIRLGGAEPAGGPRLELGNDDVGRGKPLTGKVTNLAGRRLYLILVDNEGLAYRLDVKDQPGGDAATFDIPLTPDAGSAGSNQVLLAVVSDAPIAVLEKLRQAPLQSIAGRLVDEARRATASVQADYFKLAN